MGSFVFKWEHPANQVFVTGTFDDWGKSVELEKKGDLHEKEVVLPKADEKILYKFVVDGTWTTDHTAPIETDSSGNKNNVLHPDQISKASVAQQVSAMVSNVASNTTTQALAGQVPKEEPSDLPGAFPETPAAGEAEIKVNPIPATAGAGNPISLQPGEPVPDPSTITANTIGSTVTTDKESYDKAAAPPVLPNVVTPEKERGTGMFGLDSTKNIIPESSLPIVGGTEANTIQSAGANTTVAQLAGEVPVEPRGVPAVVQESQAEAKASPEASANPEAVQEKKEVEKELEQKVPEEPPAAESSASEKAAAAITAAAASATAAAAAAAAYITSGQAANDTKAALPESAHPIVDKVAPNGSASNGAPKDSATGASPVVPEPVKESIAAANESPEAAADSAAVQEKAQVESELLKTVKQDNSAGAPAPVVAAETSATAPKPTTEETKSPAAAAVAAESKPAAVTEEPVRASARSQAPVGSLEAPKPSADSRDVSPMTRPDGTHAQSLGAKSSAKAPKSSGSSDPKPAEADKKAKRGSGFFRKLKDKFEHKKN